MLIEFQIPQLPKMMNELLRGHWQKKYRHAKVWKRLVYFEVVSQKPPRPWKKAKLTLTRVSAKRPDYDGLVSSFKHVIDGLVEAGILADDTSKVTGVPDYKWELGKPKKGFIKVKVEEL